MPTGGEVLAGGMPVTGPDPSRVVVFQDPSLYPLRTVEGNVRQGLEALRVPGDREAWVRQALELVGLDEFAQAHQHIRLDARRIARAAARAQSGGGEHGLVGPGGGGTVGRLLRARGPRDER